MQYDFAIVGGDQRQVYLANYLKNRRYQVILYGTEKKDLDPGCRQAESFLEAIMNADNIIGPIVFSKDDISLTSPKDEKELLLEEFLAKIKKRQSVFGGCISDMVRKRCVKKGVEVYDFMKMDDVAVFNAIATAEGAMSCAWLWKMCESAGG